MSGYLNKQEVLERLKKGAMEYLGNNSLIPAFTMDMIADEIESGKYAVQALEHEKAYWAREGLIQRLREEAERANQAANIKEECRLELQTEVERLRNENAAQAEEIKRMQKELDRQEKCELDFIEKLVEG
ncbi:MAG: hypothetical protein K0Q81_1918 [Paenibacillus sp.]|jgi:hypothetical protein|nr:hypothetical protein [Paenibacillus sp.]